MPDHLRTVVFVRHGESESCIGKIVTSEIEGYNLTERGRRQAAAVAQELKSVAIDEIYSSPVVRTMQTAQIISEILRLPVRADVRLTERDHGPASGMKVPSIEDEVKLYLRLDKYKIEPLSSVIKRIVAFMKTLDLGTCVAVTHSDVIRSAIVYALGLADDEFSSYGILPERATMTMVNVHSERFDVVSIGAPRLTNSMLKMISRD